MNNIWQIFFLLFPPTQRLWTLFCLCVPQLSLNIIQNIATCLEKGPSVEHTLHMEQNIMRLVLISWGCPVHVKPDPQRAELHFFAESSYGLGHKAASSFSATWGNAGSTLKKRKEYLKTLSVHPTEANTERHCKLSMLWWRWDAAFWTSWSFLHLQAACTGMSLLLSSQDAMNVKAKPRTLPRKMVLHLLISQRWQKHQKKTYRWSYHQK